MMMSLQALMYAVSAAVSALFFATWWRFDDDLKSRVWRRYGWFSALTFVGSVGGVVTAAVDIQFRYNFQRVSVLYTSNNISQQVLLLADGLIGWLLVQCLTPSSLCAFATRSFWCVRIISSIPKLPPCTVTAA